MFVLALLAGSAAAFALTERAKLERSPIYGTHVDPVVSPAGKIKPVAHIAFRVRPKERVDVHIVDRHGDTVGVLLSNRTVKPRTRLDLVWDGLTASGLLVPDGIYRPVVKLLRSHRTITLPSDIRLDTGQRFVQTVDGRPVALAGQHGAVYETAPFAASGIFP